MGTGNLIPTVHHYLLLGQILDDEAVFAVVAVSVVALESHLLCQEASPLPSPNQIPTL